jgi:hypothetical protein
LPDICNKTGELFEVRDFEGVLRVEMERFSMRVAIDERSGCPGLTMPLIVKLRRIP